MLKDLPFSEENEAESREALRMEHFYFPLLLWTVGLGLSALTFIADIIIICIAQRGQTDME